MMIRPATEETFVSLRSRIPQRKSLKLSKQLCLAGRLLNIKRTL